MAVIETIVTMPELALRSLKANWNRARWEKLPADGNRYEIIDGVLYMTTAPSFFHQWIIRRMFLALYEQIDAKKLGLTLLSPMGLFMPGCDPVQPDLFVVPTSELGIIYDRHVNGVPALIVEVLLPSNPEQDLEIKRDAYARVGVPEYWVVRPAQRDLLCYTQPDSATGVYYNHALIEPAGEVVCSVLPFRAAIAEFFRDAPDATI
jgi:Uma2 family endonuclease